MAGLSRIGKKKESHGRLAFSATRSSLSVSRSSSATSIASKTNSLGKIMKKQSRMTGVLPTKTKSVSSFLSLSQPLPEESQTMTTSQRRQAPWSVNRTESFKETSNFDSDLSNEQSRVVDSILNKKKSIFFTGSAGTGKSFLLKKIIRRLYTRFGREAVGVTAPTGLAANNIGGETIHRFLGIGLGNQPVIELVKRIKQNNRKYLTWRKLQVLIIDEISMVDGELFHKLNSLAKLLRNDDRPFGGVQLILCGDFLQLPPVSQGIETPYCFTTNAWSEVINENIILTKVFRQKGDQDLIKILNALRIGKIDRETEMKFQSLSRPLTTKNGLVPTELYPTREEVDRSNRLKLDDLDGDEFTYVAQDIDDGTKMLSSNKSLESLMCSKELKLKVGGQVMHIKNDISNPKLVNGTLGIVQAFVPESVWNLYFSKFKEASSQNLHILQMVSKLAVVAARKQERISLPDPSTLKLNEAQTSNLFELCNSFHPMEEMFPVVKFTTNDDTPILKLVKREEFKPDSSNTLCRLQLPIILAWAMSIHKSQGQTLQFVKVDLQKVFEKGQVYVALSRCVDSKGLQVVNFNRHKVSASQEVIKFYESLMLQVS